MNLDWLAAQFIRIVFLTLGFIVVCRQAKLSLSDFLRLFLFALLAAVLAPLWIRFQLHEFNGLIHGASVSYAFLGVFSILGLYWHRDRLVSRLNEGTVLYSRSVSNIFFCRRDLG